MRSRHKVEMAFVCLEVAHCEHVRNRAPGIKTAEGIRYYSTSKDAWVNTESKGLEICSILATTLFKDQV